MWNPFRRGKASESPAHGKWPPIQDLDSIDLIGERKDGGVDLVIVASQPLDDSADTCDSIRAKVSCYLTAIGSEAFQMEYGHPPREKTSIILVCDHPIYANASAVIEECKTVAAEQGTRFELRRSMR